MSERNQVNQHVLIAELAEKHGLTKTKTAEIYKDFIDSIEAHLAAGEDVVLTQFAKFEHVDKQATTHRNPQTGEQIEVPAKTVVKVRARKRLHALTEVR